MTSSGRGPRKRMSEKPGQEREQRKDQTVRRSGTGPSRGKGSMVTKEGIRSLNGMCSLREANKGPGHRLEMRS